MTKICVFSRANAEIAQVRGKAQQEQAAYQASLRKEQLKVDALERTLEQKVSSSSALLTPGQGDGHGTTFSPEWLHPALLWSSDHGKRLPKGPSCSSCPAALCSGDTPCKICCVPQAVWADGPICQAVLSATGQPRGLIQAQ